MCGYWTQPQILRKAWEHEYVIQLLPEARASFPGVAHVLHALVLVRAVAVQGAGRVQGDVDNLPPPSPLADLAISCK